MKVLNWHVPGTRDKDAELEKLTRELCEADKTITSLRQRNDELQRQDEHLATIVRQQADRAELFQSQAQNLRKEVEAYRVAFGTLAVGQDLSTERMMELARQAAQIQHDANRSCSLSYELYSAILCNEADRVIPKLNEQDAKFFQACLGSDYTPPSERGKDWQSEHEIRQDLCRQLYGEDGD